MVCATSSCAARARRLNRRLRGMLRCTAVSVEKRVNKVGAVHRIHTVCRRRATA